MKTRKEPKLLPKPRVTRKVLCTLTITTNPGDKHQGYTCRPIDPGYLARAYQLRKVGTETVYAVTQDQDGNLDCDCGARVMGGRRCKHIGALIAMGMIGDPNEMRKAP